MKNSNILEENDKNMLYTVFVEDKIGGVINEIC